MRVVVMAEVELDAENTEIGVSVVEEIIQEAFGCCSGVRWNTWLKPDETARDPRLDPKPGDRVKKICVKRFLVREVRRVENGAVQYVVDGKTYVCRLSTWLNWCRKTEVCHDGDSIDGQAEEGVGVPVV